jgi:exodeoxyribonuclease V alpha subunit
VTAIVAEPDPFDVRRARHAPGLLRAFNDAGVLTAADVHVALRLGGLAGEVDPTVLLASAFAVRGPRLGHVHVDLATIAGTAAVERDEPVNLSELPWPPAASWIRDLGASALVTIGDDGEPSNRPLRLVGSWLYLDRYWREERQVAADLLVFGGEAAADVDMNVLQEGLARLFAGETGGRQCLAAASAVLRGLTVVAGGPGTGKTTTVARIVALLAEQTAATGSPPPLIALAAPTGKAAARLEEAIQHEAAQLPVAEAIRDELLTLHASTLHRLLGWRPDSHSRFRHDRGQRLPHDVVIVDETSMVSLSLMARLVEAVRPDARLVLVGDPGQLASIEAGAVLGDVVGPAGDGFAMSAAAGKLLADATGHDVATQPQRGRASAVGDGVIVLDRVHRFGGGIARLAEAIRHGDGDAVLAVLADPREGVEWIPIEVAGDAASHALAPLRDRIVTAARHVVVAARDGRAQDAIDALGAFRLLCAHRRGPQGVESWTGRIEGWLADELADFDAAGGWYVGRPVLVTANDHELRLYNGDTGVLVQAGPGIVRAAFERRGEILELSPSRLSAIETAYAMTIHKSQGSQFETAAVLLPEATSRILTRELLYTAATRARDLLILAGTEEAIRAAVGRPVARASGLRRRLEDGRRLD